MKLTDKKIILNDHLILPRYIKLFNDDQVWLNKVIALVKNDPNVLKSYLNSNNQDFVAFLLLLHAYDIPLESSNEVSRVNLILTCSLDKNHINTVSQNSNLNINTSQDFFSYYWNKIRSNSIDRVKLLVGIN